MKKYKGLMGLHALFAAAATAPSRRDYGSQLMALRKQKQRGHTRRQRLAPAREGGNWKGVEYISYAEHDYITRTCAFIYASGGRAHESGKAALIADRVQARRMAA